MLLGDGVLIARLRDIHPRLIQFLARQRALIEEQLAAFEYFFLCVESLLRLLRIGFGLLNFFGQAGAGRGLVAGLSLLVRALVSCAAAERSRFSSTANNCPSRTALPRFTRNFCTGAVILGTIAACCFGNRIACVVTVC